MIFCPLWQIGRTLSRSISRPVHFLGARSHLQLWRCWVLQLRLLPAGQPICNCDELPVQLSQERCWWRYWRDSLLQQPWRQLRRRPYWGQLEQQRQGDDGSQGRNKSVRDKLLWWDPNVGKLDGYEGLFLDPLDRLWGVGWVLLRRGLHRMPPGALPAMVDVHAEQEDQEEQSILHKLAPRVRPQVRLCDRGWRRGRDLGNGEMRLLRPFKLGRRDRDVHFRVRGWFC